MSCPGVAVAHRGLRFGYAGRLKCASNGEVDESSTRKTQHNVCGDLAIPHLLCSRRASCAQHLPLVVTHRHQSHSNCLHICSAVRSCALHGARHRRRGGATDAVLTSSLRHSQRASAPHATRRHSAVGGRAPPPPPTPRSGHGSETETCVVAISQIHICPETPPSALVLSRESKTLPPLAHNAQWRGTVPRSVSARRQSLVPQRNLRALRCCWLRRIDVRRL